MHEAAFHRLAEEIRADIEHARALLRRHVAFVREVRSARRFLLDWRYDPDQPRVPAGSPDGGQWTSDGGSGETGQPREMMRRWPGRLGTPAQQARLTAAKARADAAVARVMQRDPAWSPPKSATSTLEGQIAHQEGVACAAEAHHAWLIRWGIGGPGQFGMESFPEPTSRPLNRTERELNDVFGYRHGSNTCGAFSPGTGSGHWIADHQPNTRWNPHRYEQSIFPQCQSCSVRQGGHILGLRGRRQE